MEIRPDADIYTEKTLYSKDRLLFGQLDGYFVTADGIDLVDYKSGTILDEDLPKDEYVNQLYFYAYLIQENYGIYPRKLLLTSRTLDSIEIAGSEQRSHELANSMRTVLAHYNDAVSNNANESVITNASSANCLFCDAKIVCPSFWRVAHQLELPNWAHCVIGHQSSPMTKTKSGNASIELNVERGSVPSGPLKITRIFPSRFPDLTDHPGQRLMLTNLRCNSASKADFAEVTDRTTVLILGSDQ